MDKKQVSMPQSHTTDIPTAHQGHEKLTVTRQPYTTAAHDSKNTI